MYRGISEGIRPLVVVDLGLGASLVKKPLTRIMLASIRLKARYMHDHTLEVPPHVRPYASPRYSTGRVPSMSKVLEKSLLRCGTTSSLRFILGVSS